MIVLLILPYIGSGTEDMVPIHSLLYGLLVMVMRVNILDKLWDSVFITSESLLFIGIELLLDKVIESFLGRVNES